jgi:hypothetical protein
MSAFHYFVSYSHVGPKGSGFGASHIELNKEWDSDTHVDVGKYLEDKNPEPIKVVILNFIRIPR